MKMADGFELNARGPSAFVAFLFRGMIPKRRSVYVASRPDYLLVHSRPLHCHHICSTSSVQLLRRLSFAIGEAFSAIASCHCSVLAMSSLAVRVIFCRRLSFLVSSCDVLSTSSPHASAVDPNMWKFWASANEPHHHGRVQVMPYSL